MMRDKIILFHWVSLVSSFFVPRLIYVWARTAIRPIANDCCALLAC